MGSEMCIRDSHYTPVANTVASLLSPGSPFLSGCSFAFFQHRQIIYTGYVEVAPGKPQTRRAKLKISPGTGEAKFSLGERKQSTGSGFTGSVTEGCFILQWNGTNANEVNIALNRQEML